MNEYEKNVYTNLFEYSTKHIVELELNNEKKDKEIERLNNIIKEEYHIKNKLLKDKKSFEKQMRDLDLIDNEDCIAYKCYDSLVCYIDNLIKFLEVSNEK